MRDNEGNAKYARDAIHWLDCQLRGEGGYLHRINGYVHPDCMTAHYLAAMSEALGELKADVDAKLRASIGNDRRAA